MSHMTPHGSGENTSGLIRWAADLRYNAPEAGDYGAETLIVALFQSDHFQICQDRLGTNIELYEETAEKRAFLQGQVRRASWHAPRKTARRASLPTGETM